MPLETYHGQPLLKAPVWTWEVPVYFFAGGAAGVAAMLAAVAGAAGHAEVARDARWLALAGAVISPALLVADLGRPGRFLNMLRVFKRRSAMSVGAWTLVLFSNAVAGTILARVWISDGLALTLLDGLAAVTGLVLATYTGVLIGATAIPVWARHVAALPVIFGFSALGAAVSLLELAGHRTASLNALGIGAAAVETLMAIGLEMRRGEADRPLHAGESGRWVRLGGILSGPLPLVLRVFAAASMPARVTAALLTLAGSLTTRFGWIAAGRASAADPHAAMVKR